jgi:2-keto-3-deoxy-L-rhamnonate aldolase RhmA
MKVIVNHARERLEAGELALGMGIRQARTVDIAHIAKTAGFDWLFIDMEHNSMSIDTAAQICAASLTAGIAPMIRVPGHESFHATRLLDAGATGIVVPHVNNADEARRVVQACRFPPQGKRSIPGLLPQVLFETHPVAEVVSAINRETLLVAMIETLDGLENVDEIAAVPGIDALLVGCTDLAAEMGLTGQLGHARVAKGVEEVCAACERHGKFAGFGGVYDEAIMANYIQKGGRLILSGSDLAFMMAGGRARTSALRSVSLEATPEIKTA